MHTSINHHTETLLIDDEKSLITTHLYEGATPNIQLIRRWIDTQATIEVKYSRKSFSEKFKGRIKTIIRNRSNANKFIQFDNYSLVAIQNIVYFKAIEKVKHLYR